MRSPARMAGIAKEKQRSATFCDGPALLSSVRGWVAKIDGADDRRFRQLLGQVTRELMGEAP